MRGTYTRWTRRADTGLLVADLLGFPVGVVADPGAGRTTLTVPAERDCVELGPDEARMLGVRLVEAAALSDADRAVRLVGELANGRGTGVLS